MLDQSGATFGPFELHVGAILVPFGGHLGAIWGLLGVVWVPSGAFSFQVEVKRLPRGEGKGGDAEMLPNFWRKHAPRQA